MLAFVIKNITSMRYLIVVGIFTVVFAYHRHLTTVVPAGDAHSFFKKVFVNQVIIMEYQVIDTTFGEMHINFHLVDEHGTEIVTDYRMAENEHTYVVAEEGIYRFCFDNTVSVYSNRTVTFDIVIRNKTKSDADDIDMQQDADETVTFLMQIQDITDLISRVEDHMFQAHHIQDLHKAREARDIKFALELRDKVSNLSISLIILIIFVGISQTILLKRLFKDRARRTPMGINYVAEVEQ